MPACDPMKLGKVFYCTVLCWIQSRIEASEKSHQTIVNECMNLEQQLSASETSRLALRDQYEQLSREVDGYRITIQQHVSLAASSKVKKTWKDCCILFFVDIFFIFHVYDEVSCVNVSSSTGLPG